MESCEVLIIGGGPAGSTCAKRLGEAGLDVLLMDARVFPRDKPCAGWITPAVLETLAIESGVAKMLMKSAIAPLMAGAALDLPDELR